MKRYLSSPFFLIALIAFFLPFFAVTCAGGGLGGLGGGGGDALTEVSGFQLITGEAEDQVAEDLQDVASGGSSGIPGLGDLPIPGPSPSIPGVPDVPGVTGGGPDLGTPQIWAIAAAVIALLGIFLSLLAGRAGGLIALVLGAGGGALLFLLASAFKTAFFEGPDAQQAEAIISVENRIGFWLALGGFALAAIMGLTRLLIPERPAAPAPGEAGFGEPPAAPAAPPPPPESPPQ